MLPLMKLQKKPTKWNPRPKTLEEACQVIDALSVKLGALLAENAALKERLNINSKNSSQPASKDVKKK